MTTLTVALVISVIINGLGAFYVWWLVKNLTFVSNNLNDMDVVFRSFEDHLQSVHEMEMFYGDETLGSLIDHTKFVKMELENYRQVMDVTEGYEEIKETNPEEAEIEEKKEE
jgi:hypothetical protein